MSSRFLAAILSVGLAGAVLAASSVPDFCFLHVSDNHLRPQPLEVSAPINEEGAADRFGWFCSQAAQPQMIEPLKLKTPPPAFVIDTGDITEYGVIGKTWSNVEDIIRTLGMPFYLSPGNHDYTWGGMAHIMRERYGGDHYSFDKFGCHFVCITTATPQEPVPSIERRTLVWLADDLARVPCDKPVFMFCHHPLSTTELAKPFEQLRLLRSIEDHNVVLMMVGHKHRHALGRWNQLDIVVGGETEKRLSDTGYNIVFVKDGILRVAFRYQDPAKPMEMVLEKPMTVVPGLAIKIESPASSADDIPYVTSKRDVSVRVRSRGGVPCKVIANVDNREEYRSILARTADGYYEGTITTVNLTPGMHAIIASANFDGEKRDTCAELLLQTPDSPIASRMLLNAGFKARPLIVGDDAIVATTAGEIVRVSLKGIAKANTIFRTGVEIVHSPALIDGRLYFSAAEKGIYCIALDGVSQWHCDVGAVVYGTPVVDGGRVYVADMEGNVHAIDRTTGDLVWSKHHAMFSVEMSMVAKAGVLYFGAWDGQVYAVNTIDGSLRWKQPGPTGQSDKPELKSRYYAPADCSPVVLADRLVVCDRGYWLGSYDLATGKYLGSIATDVAAIGPDVSGCGFYARGLAQGLTRYNEDAKVVWANTSVVTGRFPVPPSPVGDKVLICSNQGELSCCRAVDGKVLLRYQVTPQLRVMAPVAVNKAEAAYVAAMDGVITRIECSRPAAKSVQE